MAKKSILNEAEETIFEAAKTGVAVAKLAATAGLAAAGPAAAGVVLEGVSKGLKSAEETVENVAPRGASEALGLMPTPTRKKTRRNPRAKQKKRAVRKTAAAKKSSAQKKKKKASKKTATKKTAKKKRGMRRRKR
jgi:hypothetical protein